VRAAQHGHSTEVEVREILALAVKPETRVRLGETLAALGRKGDLTNANFEVFQQARVKTPAELHPAVRAWLNNQVAETLYLSSVTLAELLFGIGALPAVKRKDMLTQTLDGLMGLFRDRVLPFRTDAARRYAVTAKVAGRGFPTLGGYIAAIAASRGFIVASRDSAPYGAASVTAINPWEAKDPLAAGLAPATHYATCCGAASAGA